LKTNSKYFHFKYNIENDKLIFIYLGALAPGRGIEMLLEAFQGSEIKSHIVFMGFGEMKDNILEKSKVCEKVHFHEPVSHDEVVHLVKHANIGLCVLQNISLSDYYCLPNKLFEYVFSGIPVLATNFPDISNIIEEYKLGKYCNFNLQEVVESIIDLESNPIGKVTTDLYNLSWEAQAEKLRYAYEDILSKEKSL
jgi:glycosyltransferase involved in cell wall biosynthesis